MRELEGAGDCIDQLGAGLSSDACAGGGLRRARAAEGVRVSRLCGLFGRPYVNLEPLFDVSEIAIVHLDEIGALAAAGSRTAEGGAEEKERWQATVDLGVVARAYAPAEFEPIGWLEAPDAGIGERERPAQQRAAQRDAELAVLAAQLHLVATGLEHRHSGLVDVLQDQRLHALTLGQDRRGASTDVVRGDAQRRADRGRNRRAIGRARSGEDDGALVR